MTTSIDTATISAIQPAESLVVSAPTGYVSLETLSELLGSSVHTCERQSLTDPQTDYNVRKVYMYCLDEGNNGAWKQLLTHGVLTKLEEASGGQYLSYSSFAVFKNSLSAFVQTVQRWVDYESKIHMSKKRDYMRASLTRLRDDWNKAYLKLDEIERHYDLCGGTNPDLEAKLSAATRDIDKWNQAFVEANQQVVGDTAKTQEGSRSTIIDPASGSFDVSPKACASDEPIIEAPESSRTVGKICTSALDGVIERIRIHPTEVDQVARELRCGDKIHSYAWDCLQEAWDSLETDLGQTVVEQLVLAKPVGLEHFKQFKERFDTLVALALLYCRQQQACPVRGPVADLMELEEAQLRDVRKALKELQIQCDIANGDEVPEDFDLVQAVSQVEQNFAKICDDYRRKIRWKVDASDWRSWELAR